MKKPSAVISKTKITPKWLHKCRGFFAPRNLSLFSGMSGLAVLGSLLILGSPGNTDLINTFRKSDDGPRTHLSASMREIETAPTMVIVKNNAGSDQDKPASSGTRTQTPKQCRDSVSTYAKAKASEDNLHKTLLDSNQVQASKKLEYERHKLKLAELEAALPANCR